MMDTVEENVRAAAAADVPDDLIVVIGRQYGSGGRRLGRLVAEKLGLRYYDKELIVEAASDYGFSPKLLEQADEKKPGMLRSLLQSSFGVSDHYGPETLSCEGLYKVQSQLISKLGDKGGCVIVGRTADYILRHKPHMVSVFLHSTPERRVQNLINRGEAREEKTAHEILKKRDRKREDYYNYFTGRRWGAADNYDLTIDATLLGAERALELILHYIRLRAEV